MDAGARDLLKRVSRSMYLSLSVLPAEVRDAMGLGYLFCRAADTIADTRLVPRRVRGETLEAFRAAFEDGGRAPSADLAAGCAEHQASPAERELLERLGDCVALWRGFPAEERALLKRVVGGVADGMRMDLDIFESDSEARITALSSSEALERYCGFIGGEPGLFWTDLCLLRLPELSEKDPGALREAGFRLGCGLQITNILRDIPKDLRLGRCYLPRPELEAAGLAPSDLLDENRTADLGPVLRRWLRYGLENLEAGADYVEAMPGMRLRAAAAWPLLLALRTLAGIGVSAALLDPARPVKVGRRQVYRMLLGSPWTLSSNARFRSKFEALKERLAAVLD